MWNRAIGYSMAVTEATTNSARFAARPLAEGGTAVEVWTQSDRRFAPLDIEGCPALVVVSAHPDDETLGLGATASALGGGGITVQVMAVTDGEAAYPEDASGRSQLAETVGKNSSPQRPDWPGETDIPRVPDGEVTAQRGAAGRRVGGDPGRIPRRAPGVLRRGGATVTPTTRRPAGPPRPRREAPLRCSSSTRYGCGTGPSRRSGRAVGHRARPPLRARDVAAKSAAMQCFSSQLQRGDGPPL